MTTFLRRLSELISGERRRRVAQAEALANHMRNSHGSLRAWGAGFWTAEMLGRVTVNDRVFAVTDKGLAWGLAPHLSLVVVDFRENLTVDVDQVADGSWSVALLPADPGVESDRYPSVFNFAEVYGGDLESSQAVVDYLLTKFPRKN